MTGGVSRSNDPGGDPGAIPGAIPGAGTVAPYAYGNLSSMVARMILVSEP